MKKFVATYVDHGETCDGKARVLCVKNTKVEALAAVKEDMSVWYDEYKEEGVEIDFCKMSAHFDFDSDKGCEWNIEEVEIYDDKEIENEAGNL